MTKIAIVTTQVPFIYGGAEFLADSLRNKLIEFGYSAEVLKMPFKWYPTSAILDHMLAAKCMRLINVDRVIALKFPAYYIPHENKVLWLLHQFRQAYDLWDTPYQSIPESPDGVSLQRVIAKTDTETLGRARKIYTISKTVSGRLRKFNGLESEVLYPPLMDSHLFQAGEFGDYIFYPSRISRSKRQCMAVEALRYTRTKVRLVIAGAPDNAEEMKLLHNAISDAGVEDRVSILGRISQEEKAQWFTNALATTYLPYDEDYGYVSLESFHSSKPIITFSDSGGTLEIVEDGLNGYVVPPQPCELAAVMDRLFADRTLAFRMGAAGREKLCSMRISWEQVIESLTS
ncbi:MAG TPA: glycosyltransferase family 4 protein [Terriglobales bacterium]|nr:glycosyltransferase family 4 protein [Terriglobales bacterium]